MTGHGAGHRRLPHPADVMLQAWAPTPQRCLEEAVCALVGSFADVSDTRPERVHEFEVSDPSWDTRLVTVYEEVLFLLDARGEVVLHASVTAAGDGLLVSFDLARAEEVVLTGSTPKGIARSGLEFCHRGDRWQATAIVDV